MRSFTKLYQGDHIKEEEMHVTVSMYTKFSSEHMMGRDHTCDLDIDRRIILK
jgi:hypothetical protein